MSPTPIASVTFAPQPSSSLARKAGSPPPGSPATRTRWTLDFRRSWFSARYAAYDGVSTTASGFSDSIARTRSSVFPVPTGMCTSPMLSKAASAAPATNGPALYVETIRWPGSTPEAA